MGISDAAKNLASKTKEQAGASLANEINSYSARAERNQQEGQNTNLAEKGASLVRKGNRAIKMAKRGRTALVAVSSLGPVAAVGGIILIVILVICFVMMFFYVNFTQSSPTEQMITGVSVAIADAQCGDDRGCLIQKICEQAVGDAVDKELGDEARESAINACKSGKTIDEADIE